MIKTKEYYKEVFKNTEANLIKIGSETLPVKEIIKNLEWAKTLEGSTFSDFDFYQKLVAIVFYSGFKAATVSAKLETIFNHFPDYDTVASYDEKRIAEILNDSKMIRNRNKIKACFENAKTFRKIVKEFDSFQNYIDSFNPYESFENLFLLKEELEYNFKGLGKITTYHFLTDIGLPVLKPDRVICRIFKRLGLIKNENQLLQTVIQGRKFAEFTGYPIRYIDIIFVVYGQMAHNSFGIERGICLEKNPQCNKCTITNFCNYYQQSNE